jgi:hypothetical protein
MKNDLAAFADERDMVRQGFQEDVRLRIRRQRDAVRGRRRYKKFARLFTAFPEIAAISVAGRHHNRSAVIDVAMLTKDMSVVSYVWQEVKDMLVFQKDVNISH